MYIGRSHAIYMHLFSIDLWQWSDSLGDLPNILGKVGRAGMGIGSALEICCHHLGSEANHLLVKHVFIPFHRCLSGICLKIYYINTTRIMLGDHH